MTRDEVLRAFDEMRVWQRGDKRAVHKPLLVLYALSQFGKGQPAFMDWQAVFVACCFDQSNEPLIEALRLAKREAKAVIASVRGEIRN